MKTTTITTTLVSLNWGKTTDGTAIVCAITKEGNLHTKTSTRSYLVALEGAAGAVAFAREALEKGAVELLSGATITWERTTYEPKEAHIRNGATVVMEDEDIIDHITKIDLQPIAIHLLQKKTESLDKELSPLQEKLLVKSFGVEL